VRAIARRSAESPTPASATTIRNCPIPGSVAAPSGRNSPAVLSALASRNHYMTLNICVASRADKIFSSTKTLGSTKCS